MSECELYIRLSNAVSQTIVKVGKGACSGEQEIRLEPFSFFFFLSSLFRSSTGGISFAECFFSRYRNEMMRELFSDFGDLISASDVDASDSHYGRRSRRVL